MISSDQSKKHALDMRRENDLIKDKNNKQHGNAYLFLDVEMRRVIKPDLGLMAGAHAVLS